MSKDKGSRNVKKAPSTTVKNNVSDYQAGKKTVSKDEVTTSKKK